MGFRVDRMGVNDFCEEERKRCLTIIANGEVTADIVPPMAVLEDPFIAQPGARVYECHNGELISLDFLRQTLPEIYRD
jgi:hypothetical protein